MRWISPAAALTVLGVAAALVQLLFAHSAARVRALDASLADRTDTRLPFLVPVGAPFPVISGKAHQTNPAVAYDSRQNRYLIVWQDTGDDAGNVYGQLIEGNGERRSTSFPISTAWGLQGDPAVAYDDQLGHHLVVWQDFRHGETSGWDIYTQAVSADGELLDDKGARISCAKSALLSGARHLCDLLSAGARLLAPVGCLLADGFDLEGDRDVWERLALWSGLSMALIPLGLLWLTVIGIRVTGLLAWAGLLAILALVLWRWLRRVNTLASQRVDESLSQQTDGLVRPRDYESASQRVNESLMGGDFRPAHLPVAPLLPRCLVNPLPRCLINSFPDNPTSVVILAILLVTAVLRFWPLTELVLPSWIDSVHHVVITKLILDRGGVPDTYQPFLPVAPFLYHFGFHALSAVFVWLTGIHPAMAVLIVGQALSFLAPLGIYWMTLRLSGLRWAGVISALIVGTMSLMPTHYVNWGRYTHLAGLSLLPAAIVLAVDALSGTAGRWTVVAAAVALAGLTLTHYRAVVFALIYLIVYLPVSLLFKSTGQPNARSNRRLANLFPYCFITLFLTPWLVRIGRAAFSQTGIWSGLAVDAAYNAFPHDLLLASVSRPVAVLAVWGWLMALWRRQGALVAMGLWVPALFLVANPQVVGLKSSPLVTNSSVVVSLYLPLSVLAGYCVAMVIAEVEGRVGDRWRRRHSYALAVLTVLLALWGARSLWPVITPETVLADEEDRLALSWVEQNTLPEARFLIGARHWQANIYVGTDSGYWITALTGRQTTMPPAPYVLGTPEYVARVNAMAEMVAAGPDVDDLDFRQWLAREGVTHVYLGTRGSPLPRQSLLESNHYSLVYASGNVWIFEVLSSNA